MGKYDLAIKFGKNLVSDVIKCSKSCKKIDILKKSSLFQKTKITNPVVVGDTFEYLNTLKTSFTKQISLLSKEQRQSLNAYTQLEGFEKLNSWLRQPENLNIENWRDALIHKNMLYHSSNIDDSLKCLEAPFDFTVYRGISHLNLDDILKLRGKNLTDLGYGSSSLSPKVAENFGDVVFKIKIKKGMNCGYLDDMSDFKDIEQEVLLPRGYTIKIGDVKPYKNSDGKIKYLVNAEMQKTSKPKSIKTYYNSLCLGKYPEFDFLSDVEQAGLNLSNNQLLAIKSVENINKYLKNPNIKKTIRILSEDKTTIKEIPIQEIMEARIANIDNVLQLVKSSEPRTVYFNKSELILSNGLNTNIEESFINKGYIICKASINKNNAIRSQNMCKLELPEGTNFYFDERNGNIILPRFIKIVGRDSSYKLVR